MVEREDISSTKLVFEHDWTQLLYCYNVYSIVKTVYREKVHNFTITNMSLLLK